jgi:hypothetical protein
LYIWQQKSIFEFLKLKIKVAMKIKMLIVVLATLNIVTAQDNRGIVGATNWFNGWTNFKPKTTEYPNVTQTLSGEIKVNTTLTKKNVYLLLGIVRVTNGATLTIEPGTIIRGDYDYLGTLIITKGSKIIAKGEENLPIVFTTNKSNSDRKSGTWGGIILMGDAPLNTKQGELSSLYDKNELHNSFGGKNETSDSGILKYVRIEYAGGKNDAKVALNGLTLAAVGSKTKIDHVQISFSGDDAVEVIGGNIDLNNIITYRNGDDDFDYSMGTQSNLQNSIAIRNPYISDNSRSRCLEIDSYDKIENFDPTKKKTLVKLTNVTLLNDETSSMQGLIKEAISLKTDSFIEMTKCVVAGFSSVMALDETYAAGYNYKVIKVYDSKIDSCTGMFTDEGLNKIQYIDDWFLRKDKLLDVTLIGMNSLFISTDIKKGLDFRLK